MAKFTSEDIKKHRQEEIGEKEVVADVVVEEVVEDGVELVEPRVEVVDEKEVAVEAAANQEIDVEIEEEIEAVAALVDDPTKRIHKGKIAGLAREYDNEPSERDLLGYFRNAVMRRHEVKGNRIVDRRRKIPLFVIFFSAMIPVVFLVVLKLQEGGEVSGEEIGVIFLISMLLLLVMSVLIYFNRQVKKREDKVVCEVTDETIDLPFAGMRFRRDEVYRFYYLSRYQPSSENGSMKDWIGMIIKNNEGRYEYWCLWKPDFTEMYSEFGWKRNTLVKFLKKHFDVEFEFVKADWGRCQELSFFD
ncbi:hypothetical protein JD969_09790 [Planctomycetota bacterium]|nr:hypothetical protein JD969_09790 [Planctomycetota bacterium]